MRLSTLLQLIHKASSKSNHETKLRARIKLPDENRLVEVRIIGVSAKENSEGHIYIDCETL